MGYLAFSIIRRTSVCYVASSSNQSRVVLSSLSFHLSFMITNAVPSMNEDHPSPLEKTKTHTSLAVSHTLNKDVDVAALYDEHVSADPRARRNVRIKADLIVSVTLTVIYTLMYMCKVMSSNTSIMGIRNPADPNGYCSSSSYLADHPNYYEKNCPPGLDMDGSQYPWVGSSFYFGYLAFNLFGGTIFLQHVPIGLGSGAFVILWGVIVCCMGSVQNYPSLIALRVLQGICEGSSTPALMIVISQWYRIVEQFGRVNVWYAGVGAGVILVDAIAYGLYTNNSLPMEAWRLSFIIVGVLSIGFGLIYCVLIPAHPAKAWFLTHEEKIAAIERARDNKQGFGNRRTKLYQIKEAIIDVRTWIYFASFILLNITNGGITNFNAIIIENMGYDTKTTLLMDMPSGACQFFVQLFLPFITERFFCDRRMYYVIFFGALNVMCLCFLAWGTNKMGLAGYYLWGFAAPVADCGLLSMVTSNSAGYTKKLVVSGIVMVGYCVGNICGPQTFKESEADNYPTAKATMAGCSVAALFLFVVLLIINIFENKRRDRKNEKLPPEIEDPEFADLTDFENPEFRYAL